MCVNHNKYDYKLKCIYCPPKARLLWIWRWTLWFSLRKWLVLVNWFAKWPWVTKHTWPLSHFSHWQCYMDFAIPEFCLSGETWITKNRIPPLFITKCSANQHGSGSKHHYQNNKQPIYWGVHTHVHADTSVADFHSASGFVWDDRRSPRLMAPNIVSHRRVNLGCLICVIKRQSIGRYFV